MPSRRQFLAACATGGAVALAGCADPDVAMFVDELPDDRAIAEQATTSRDDDLEVDHPDLVADAVDGGTEVVGGRSSPDRQPRAPYTPDRPVRHDGAVYELRWETVGTETRTEYRIAARAGGIDREPEIALEELPEPDQRAIEGLHLPPAEHFDDERDLRLEQLVYYDDAELEQSVLAPEPEYEVIGVHDGVPVEIDVAEVEAERDVFEYSAERLADSLSGFGQRVREAYLFELEGLDAEQREFFEDVAGEGSYYDTSPGQPFEGVADRIVAEPAVATRDREGVWLLEYDGDAFWVRIDFVRMEEYADRIEVADGPVAVWQPPEA